MEEYPLKEECYEIIGCCMEVHNQLGCGFLETVYQEALAIELDSQCYEFEKEKVLDIRYKGNYLTKRYIVDFLVFGEVLVELKAVSDLSPEHLAQVLNYLKATGKKVALLVNFGKTKLQYKRVVL